MRKRDLMLGAAGALALPFALPAARAAEFPDHPVRVIVPFPPGGSTDIVARVVCERLGARWRQPVVIENRGGAGTIVGSQVVARATPDGHTLGFVISAHTINPAIRNDLPYDTLRDFAAVSQVARAHVVICATPSLPASDLAAMVALSKQRPEGLSFATPGIGTVMHMIMEMLAGVSGAQLTHVPYQGGAPALTDAMQGRVPLILDTWHALRPHVEAGRLKVIAGASGEPIPGAPQVPIIAKDYPGFSAYSVIGLAAPAATPKALVDQIAADIRATVLAPENAAKLAELGVEPVGSSPAEFRALVESEITRWKQVVKDRNITAM
ncbi:Bug family tripartite tricarboxylate transporter substrate binding protein [Roseomonas sp. BN140053]|uniref:Bug family tripartite tricarboxylate transporter substrate binding protein n=1 Tax=Roseomonas sp. BN140053 TaxID=3391898 RepID=UPI0039EA8E16